MKILIYGLNYSPELIGVGKYTGEMAVWLKKKGHDVRVIAAPPYYPLWRVIPPYSASQWRYEKADGIPTWRCPIWVPRIPSGIKRVVHLLSFAISSAPIVAMQIFWRPDIVWTVEPTIFTSFAAKLLALVCRAKSCIHIQDYELDAAFKLKIIKNEFIGRYACSIESFMLRRFDLVSTISKQMIKKGLEKGIQKEKLILFPNWINISSHDLENNELQVAKFRKEFDLPSNAFIALYSGNMGAKQGLEILEEVARIAEIKKIPSNLYFIFCGNGPGRAGLESGCKNLKNVRFLNLQPIEILPEFLASADVHLLPQRADAEDLVMPSKLIGMLASRRPVIATANEGTGLANLIQKNQCGLISEPGGALGMYEAIALLESNRELSKKFGDAGIEFIQKNLDEDLVMCAYEQRLCELVSQKVARA